MAPLPVQMTVVLASSQQQVIGDVGVGTFATAGFLRWQSTDGTDQRMRYPRVR